MIPCDDCPEGWCCAVFVFGSNLAGRHGKGAALFAKERRGAKPGKGEGHYGNSYAIPTKDKNLRTRSLVDIQQSVWTFLDYAGMHPELKFKLTPIGCGLAGYKPKDIAPMFLTTPKNVQLPEEFLQFFRMSNI